MYWFFDSAGLSDYREEAEKQGHVPILEYTAQVRENCATISDGVTRILNPPITHYGFMLSLLHVPAPTWGILLDKKDGSPD